MQSNCQNRWLTRPIVSIHLFVVSAVVFVQVCIFQFPAFSARAADQAATKELAIPARDPRAKWQLLDLSKHYNASLAEVWHGDPPGNDLSSLPTGVQRLAGIDFDLRGIVQVSSRALKLAQPRYPEQVKGIQVGQKLRRLHFLHACGWRMAKPGTRIGSYVIHYATGVEREIPIIYGRDVQDWHNWEPLPPRESSIAWAGTNLASRRLGTCIRLFKSTWENPLPDATVASIDFISEMGTQRHF